MSAARAAIIAVGTELLRGSDRDGNSEWLSSRLNELGIPVAMQCRVGDVEGEIAALITVARKSSDVVILTGGLGPTEDDRTRQALAAAYGTSLVKDPDRVALLRSFFEKRGRHFTPEQERQAMKPEGSEWLDNPVGTAPGLLIEEDGLLAALPGVPLEMRTMFDDTLAPRIGAMSSGVLARRSMWIAGRTESSVDQALRDLYDTPGLTVTVLSGAKGIEVQLSIHSVTAHEAASRLSVLERCMTERLGDDLYGIDDDTLAGVVAGLMMKGGKTLATAESCTAGLLAGAITDVPGSSSWFRGGVVVYADDLKISLAGVGRESLERYGSVSGKVAGELAEGVRSRCNADIGVGITGIAGPAGGTPGKPVGLVYLAISDGGRVEGRKLSLPGDRAQIRARTVTAALDSIRRHLMQEIQS